MAKHQKFFRGQSIRVGDTPNTGKKREIDGVIFGTFKEQNSNDDRDLTNEYFSIVQINDQGEPVSFDFWYHDSEMTLVCDNRARGEKIIQKWQTRKATS